MQYRDEDLENKETMLDKQKKRNRAKKTKKQVEVEPPKSDLIKETKVETPKVEEKKVQ